MGEGWEGRKEGGQVEWTSGGTDIGVGDSLAVCGSEVVDGLNMVTFTALVKQNNSWCVPKDI